jgi:Nop53 (60S ribosomal biogenesis)
MELLNVYSMISTEPMMSFVFPRIMKGKPAASATGAPAQHNQSSRKGKKAWRKNIDTEVVDNQLEEMRNEERMFG